MRNLIYKRELIAARDFPHLKWRWIEGKPVLSGNYHFKGEKDGLILSGDFLLRIEFPKEYPQRLPIVFEENEVIPVSYHHNPDFSLCLGTQAELYMLFSGSPGLITFMTKILDPYLYRWLAYAKGYPVWKDSAHGIEGLIEGYRSLLKVESIDQICDSLWFILTHNHFQTSHPCPCGSGLKTKHCHRQYFHLVSTRVPKYILAEDWSVIAAYIRSVSLS